MRFRRAAGVRVEPLGETWAAFSALSGDTLLINIETAAILEFLADGPADALDVARMLARDTDTELVEVNAALGHAWDQLVSAGLAESVDAPEHHPG